MRLSDKAIQEFREIFHREFKRDLSDEEARQRAESFMHLILLLLRPMPAKPAGKNKGIAPWVDETPPSDMV
jgi:hypothetical protein